MAGFWALNIDLTVVTYQRSTVIMSAVAPTVLLFMIFFGSESVLMGLSDRSGYVGV